MRRHKLGRYLAIGLVAIFLVLSHELRNSSTRPSVWMYGSASPKMPLFSVIDREILETLKADRPWTEFMLPANNISDLLQMEETKSNQSSIQKHHHPHPHHKKHANATVMEHHPSSERMDAVEARNLKYAYQSQEEMDQRKIRFPSINERVRIYMSNWYLPPCTNDNRVVYEYVHNPNNDIIILQELAQVQPPPLQESPHRKFLIDSRFDGAHATGIFDYVHYLNRTQMNATCTHRYCKDFQEYLFPALNRVQMKRYTSVPILFQFGDEEKTKATQLNDPNVRGYYPAMPVIKKIRQSLTSDELDKVTTVSVTSATSPTMANNSDHPYCGTPQIPRVLNSNVAQLHILSDRQEQGQEQYHLQPIVFKVKTQRHYSRVFQIPPLDIIWEHKLNQSIFRGDLTGKYLIPIKDDTKNTWSVNERCRLLPRCWLVYQHAHSTLVDAKLAQPYKGWKDIPETIDDIPLYGKKLELQEMLQYKVIIMIEGNDVASGLKWALFSNSLVMMPIPTYTTWAMEEKLQPWVHYIPITIYNQTTTDQYDGTKITDVEEKMQWVLDHDKEAQQIAKAGKLWISDLVLHPNAASDETKIFDEIVYRYCAHFASKG